MCEFCEKARREIFCGDCKQNFCKSCFDSHHTPNKKWANHAIFNTTEEENAFRFPCKCPSRMGLSIFCQDCSTGACNECLPNHETHKTITLKSIYEENENNAKNLQNQKYLSKAIEDLNRLDKALETQTNQYNNFLNKTIMCLNMMKEKSEKDQNKIKTRIKWFQNSMSNLIEEIDQVQFMHPNKLTHLDSFFNSQVNPIVVKVETEEKPYYMKDFKKSFEDLFNQIHFEINTKRDPEIPSPKLNPKSKSNSILHQNTNSNSNLHFHSTSNNSNSNSNTKVSIAPLQNNSPNALFALNRFNNFLTNAVKFQENHTTVIDQNSFFFAFAKSNVSTSFAISNETFVVWGGVKSLQGLFSVHIYNLFRKKKELVIDDLQGPLSVMNTYPIDQAYDSKKLLYFADSSGVLRVLDISKKDFKETYRIDTQSGRGIIAAMLFDDRYNEVINDNQVILAMISFNDAEFPLRIYNCQNGALVKEIFNPTNFCCFAMNYFFDEKEMRLRFFLGFSRSFIMEYHLKLGVFYNYFKTQGGVSSINFIFREKKRWIVFTQENRGLITIGNIKNRLVLNEKEVGLCSNIYDLCVWNMKNQIIVAGAMENQTSSILIMDTKNLTIAKRIELKEKRPVNLQKVLILHPKFQKMKENLVLFQRFENESAVVLFE